MKNTRLKDLLKAKGETCVSIIIPTHPLSYERRGDKIELKKAVRDAKDELIRHVTYEQFQTYEAVLEEWVKKVDYTRNLEGLGMFVSPSVNVLFKFPFPVKEKIVVSNSFEIRDVAYTESFAAPYYVLVLSEKNVRLLRGSLDTLVEIEDENFPDVYEDDHEYQKPNRSSSYASQSTVQTYEGDKSVVVKMRTGQFFRVIDKRLTTYLVDEKTPLIIVAPNEEIALFEHKSKHQKNITGKIKGNYTFLNESQLAELVFPEYVRYTKAQTLKLIRKYTESIGYNLGVEGVNDIWHAVKEGKGRKLVVEKDFTQEAYTQSGENRLLFKEPQGAHKVIRDVIDDIIETMMGKGGEVYFTDNGKLEAYGKMFLIKHY
jgi:Bacterial archaeo-eukaryotic release factor family 3